MSTKRVGALPLWDNAAVHDEVTAFIVSRDLPYLVGKAVLHASLYESVGPTSAKVRDLQRAKWYLEREIARLENEG